MSMDPAKGAGQDPIAAYDRWRNARSPEASTDRVVAVKRLIEVIRPLIEVSDNLCNVARGPLPLSELLAAFEYEGRDYLLQASDVGPREIHNVTAEFAKRAAASSEIRHVLLCTSPQSALVARRAAQLLGEAALRVIVLDRSHLEAAVCGVTTLADLMRLGLDPL